MNFARENNLRLVVKGGGHSYQGTSNSADSLLIWTRDMHAITLRDSFVAAGCTGAAPRPAVTVEAGARWLRNLRGGHDGAGRYVQGGGCATVGVAGLVQSGGFGSFSKNYGTAAASLLEAEIVTADGKVRTVSACQSPDLFWALKGGGGGSLGVVTKVTLATHALPENFGAAEGRIQAKSPAAFRRLIGEFVRFYRKALFNPHWGEQATFGKDDSLSLNLVMQGLTLKEAEAAWMPFAEFVAASPDDFEWTAPLDVATFPARHWWDAAYRKARDAGSIVSDARPGAPPGNVYWKGNAIEVNVFLYGYESLWLPGRAARRARIGFADALFAATRQFDGRPALQQGPGRRARGAGRRRARHRHEPGRARRIRARHHRDRERPTACRAWPDTSPTSPRDASRRPRSRPPPTRCAPSCPTPAPTSRSPTTSTDVAEVVLGPELPAARGGEEEVRPDGLFFVHNGVGQRRMERRRLQRKAR